MPILSLCLCIHTPQVSRWCPFVFRVTLRPSPMPRVPRTCVFVLSYFHHVHGHGRVGIESRSSSSTLLPLASPRESTGIRPRPTLSRNEVRSCLVPLGEVGRGATPPVFRGGVGETLTRTCGGSSRRVFGAKMADSAHGGRLIYALVARERTVLAEYTAFTGNFAAVAAQCLEKCPSQDAKLTYRCDGHTFNFLIEDGLSCVHDAIECAGGNGERRRDVDRSRTNRWNENRTAPNGKRGKNLGTELLTDDPTLR